MYCPLTSVLSFLNPKPRQSLGASAYLCQPTAKPPRRLDRRWPREQLTAVL
jgi:hypothetical protein